MATVNNERPFETDKWRIYGNGTFATFDVCIPPKSSLKFSSARLCTLSQNGYGARYVLFRDGYVVRKGKSVFRRISNA